MEEKKDQDVQETPEEETPEDVTISAKELEDLKHRAEVSSQNFERLKDKEKELEALKLKENNSDTDADYFSDNEKESNLEKEIAALNKKVEKQSQSMEMDRLYAQYPAIKDNAERFQTYSEDPINAGMPLPSRVKAFLIENDLLEKPVKRKGLEKSTGGKTDKKSSGKMTAEDLQRLRETNPRKWMALVESSGGDIELAD